MKQNQTEFFFYPEAKEGSPRVVIAGVFDPEFNTLRIAKSECSVKDTFCKAKGRAIALGRAKCNRELDVKFYMRGEKTIVKSNSHLLPTMYTLAEVTEDKNTTIQHQFINIAKSL